MQPCSAMRSGQQKVKCLGFILYINIDIDIDACVRLEFHYQDII